MRSTTKSQLIYHNILKTRRAMMEAKRRGDTQLATEYQKEITLLWTAHSKQKKEDNK